MNPGRRCVGETGTRSPLPGGILKQTVLLIASLAASLALSCNWVPPEPAMVIAGEPVPRSELSCPDRLPDSADQCREIERLKTRRVIFDHMLDKGLAASGATVGAQVDEQIDSLIARMAPSFEQHAVIMRCHAIAALESLGEPIEVDPSCLFVDPRQVDQLVASLSRRELRELVEDDLVAKMNEAQRTNLRAEATLGSIRDRLQQTGRDEAEFWSEVYDSLDPLFYDARLEMGPAEVITGNPAGWRQAEDS